MQPFADWPSWFTSLIQVEAQEPDATRPSASEDINIIDPKAVGSKVRPVTLALFQDPEGATLDLTWKDSDYKIFNKQYNSVEDASTEYNRLQATLLEINKLILESQMEAAEAASQTVLQKYTNLSPAQQTTTAPITQTQANLRLSILVPPLGKEGKATVQNIFFSNVDELMDYMEKMKKMQPSSTEDVLPGGVGGENGLLPADTEALPGGEGPLVETPAQPSALEKMVEEQVREKVESSLDQRAKSVFEDRHAEAVKVLRNLGRSWEEIKDFFNRYLKYDWEDIDIFLEQFQDAEKGEREFRPGVEKVKQELEEDALREKHAPEKLEPVPASAIAQQSKNVSKQADLVRDPDTLQIGDKVEIIRTVLATDGTIIPPTVLGSVVSVSAFHIVVDSSVGRFTLSKPDCAKLDKKASLQTQGEKYYLQPGAEYDWEADLVDEISIKYGAKGSKWDFPTDKWDIQYDEKGPFVEIRLLSALQPQSIALHAGLGKVLVHTVDDYTQVEDTRGNFYWVLSNTLTPTAPASVLPTRG